MSKSISDFVGNLEFFEKQAINEIIKLLNQKKMSPIKKLDEIGKVLQTAKDSGWSIEKIINGRNEKGINPLVLAARKGDQYIDIIKMLFEHGKRKDVTNKKGYTPLAYAAKYEQSEIVKYLTSKSDTIGEKDQYEITNKKNGKTPLQLAVKNQAIMRMISEGQRQHDWKIAMKEQQEKEAEGKGEGADKWELELADKVRDPENKKKKEVLVGEIESEGEGSEEEEVNLALALDASLLEEQANQRKIEKAIETERKEQQKRKLELEEKKNQERIDKVTKAEQQAKQKKELELRRKLELQKQEEAKRKAEREIAERAAAERAELLAAFQNTDDRPRNLREGDGYVIHTDDRMPRSEVVKDKKKDKKIEKPVAREGVGFDSSAFNVPDGEVGEFGNEEIPGGVITSPKGMHLGGEGSKSKSNKGHCRQQ